MDKRIYGRVPVNLRATVANEGGVELQVTALETTGESVNVLCSLEQRDAIAPGGNIMVGGRPMRVSVTLRLPGAEWEDAVVRAKCNVMSCRRLSIQECVMRLRYVEIDSLSHKHLENFLKKAIGAPRGSPK